MKKEIKILTGTIIAVIVTFLLVAVPLPYYITTPGSAQELTSFVQVEDGDAGEGELMLVTVSMSRASILRYVLAAFQDYSYIFTKEEILGDSDSDEYTYQQLRLMQNSQQSAIQVAYERAGKKVETINKGIVVLGVDSAMPAAGILEVGDTVTAIDGEEMLTSEEFISYLQDKTEGDTVEITFTRDEETFTEELTLQTLATDESRAGLGVEIQTVTELVTDPEIEIDASGIGGPSAGMMFTLEIYDQLTDGDLTRGHRVAGTGTINASGQVGPIGGVNQKVVAADNEGAEIFFAPNFEMEGGSNYEIAVETAEAIGSDMIIVPVDTIDDAIGYLENLEER